MNEYKECIFFYNRYNEIYHDRSSCNKQQQVVKRSIFHDFLFIYFLSKPPEEDLDLEQSQWDDIHVITGALKLFFRELPEPLFPFSSFQPFVEAISELKTSQISSFHHRGSLLFKLKKNKNVNETLRTGNSS